MLVNYEAHSPGHAVAGGAELLVCSGTAFLRNAQAGNHPQAPGWKQLSYSAWKLSLTYQMMSEGTLFLLYFAYPTYK